jgi:hypothetical protein
MNYRINTKIMTAMVVLIVLAVVLFVVTLVSAPLSDEFTEGNIATSSQQAEEQILTAKHQYQNGVHTIAGKVEVPTPCHRLVTESFFTKTEPVGVEVRFSTLLEGGECPSQPFEVPFTVTFEAPENVAITGVWNGTPIRLNLIPLKVGETLEDELYIKG